MDLIKIPHCGTNTLAKILRSLENQNGFEVYGEKREKNSSYKIKIVKETPNFRRIAKDEVLVRPEFKIFLQFTALSAD